MTLIVPKSSTHRPNNKHHHTEQSPIKARSILCLSRSCRRDLQRLSQRHLHIPVQLLFAQALRILMPVDLLLHALVSDGRLTFTVAAYLLQIQIALVTVVRIANGLIVVVLKDLVHACHSWTIKNAPVLLEVALDLTTGLTSLVGVLVGGKVQVVFVVEVQEA